VDAFKYYDIIIYGIIFMFQIIISLKINSVFTDHDKLIQLEERINNLIKDHDKNHKED
jgi:uncharacterized membrane protein YcjF (UPF0283 family)